jgi:uncharacterized SAM-binding protein YcdF (DUF218 family)
MMRQRLQAKRRGERGGMVVTLIVLLCFLLFCFVIYLARHPLMRWSANLWIIEDPLDKADAIIVLSDDNFYADRATRAAELFRQGKAPLIVASGKRLRPIAGIAELMEHDLTERGVPKEKILRVVHDADGTREEAEALLPVVRQKNWHALIIVTSNYHTRRARYIFGKVFPQGVDIRVASARDADFDPDRWWEKRKSIKELTREWAAMLVAMWELRGQPETHETSQSVVERKEFQPQPVV